MIKIKNFKKAKVFFVAICILMLLPSLPTFIANNSKTTDSLEEGLHTSALTEILRPDGDITTQWNTPTPHWNRLNEAVINPNPGDTTGILANGDNYNNKIELFSMTDCTQFSEKVLKIEVHTYGRSFGNSNPEVRIWWGDWVTGGGWTARQTVNLPRSPMPGPLAAGWATNTWELQGNEADVNNIHVEYLSHCTGWFFIPPYFSIPIGSNSIYTSYCEVTYKEVSAINPFDIYSPEDMIYSSPTEGYYPASYGFENEPHVQTGTDIDFLDEYHGDNPLYESYYDIRVLNGPYNGHNKVLHMRDSQMSQQTWGEHHFDNPPSSGTIEFWLDVYPYGLSYPTKHFLYIQDASNNNVMGFYVDNKAQEMYVYDAGNWVLLMDNLIHREWYHHSVTFDCSSETYTWIVSDSSGVVVGNIFNADFSSAFTGTTVNDLRLETGVGFMGSTNWDAFGFDWEPDYNLRDNTREGILLYYDSSIPLDWVGLILDDNPIQTLTGDTVLSLYDVGDHILRLKGEDSANIYFSDEIYYSCEPDGWHTIPIGGLDRRFAQEKTPTRLGYTFFPVSCGDPTVQFKISEVGDDGDVTINLYLEKDPMNPSPPPTPFWSTTLDIDGSEESEMISVDLANYKSNTLVIEIENSGDPGFYFTLDYLEINDCFFKDYNYDDARDYYYSPTTFKEEDETKDYLTVSTNTLLTDLLNPEGLIDKDIANNPHFSTSLIAAIDDDIEATNPYLRYYFIQSVKYEIRILDPNGNYIDNNRLWIEEDEMQTSAEVDPDPAYENDDLKFLIQSLVHMIIDYIPYIDVNFLYNLLIYLGAEDTITDSTFVNGWQDDHLYIKWEDGIINYGDINIWNFDYHAGVKPRNNLKEISLWSHWQCNPRTTYGDYQVEISWEIEVKEYQKVMFITFPFIVCWYHEINEGFTETGSQYFNFDFIE